jgi:DNA-binding response OmpR family regulator
MMKFVLLYEDKKNRIAVAKQFTDAGHEVIVCESSNDFFLALEKGGFDRMIIDVKSWFRGLCVYRYFGIARKMVNIPVLFINTPEGFTVLDNVRPKNPLDLYVLCEEGRENLVARVA